MSRRGYKVSRFLIGDYLPFRVATHYRLEKFASSCYTFYFLVSLSSYATFALLLPAREKVQGPLC